MTSHRHQMTSHDMTPHDIVWRHMSCQRANQLPVT